MYIKEEDLKKIVNEEFLFNKLHKIRENGLFLSDEEISLLEQYHIDYKKCSNLMQLVHEIDEINEDENSLELDNLASYLAEQHYYNNVNK